jgi:Flp pilus assembly pilin Flp
MSMSQFFKRFKSDRRGATTVEYFVLLAFIALGGIAAVQTIQGKIGSVANKLGGNVEALTPFAK